MTTSASILGYRRFLEVRDGDPDVYSDTLSRREEFFRRIEGDPVRSERVFDRDTYLRNVLRRRIEPGLDERMLWLLATAKANQSERFGVELGKLYGRGPAEDAGPEEIHVVLQESYHTRILADVAAIFGLPVPQCPPNWTMRRFIEVMVCSPLPERFVLPLVGMSEMMGCIMFRLMRDRGMELFADEPAVAERIGVLYDEILADEICHVGLVEARLGRFGRSVMRGLYRLLAARFLTFMGSEYLAVIGPEKMRRSVEAPFDQGVLAAEFPDTAYAF